jgi:carbonic anhydrase
MGLSYKQVFENNSRWVAEKRASDSDFFEKLSGDQQPDYLYIGCSDSRVSAEIFMGAEPGEVFVHRNIANQVNLSDRNAMSVIHFAVDQLRVKHIVVCGHYMCNGVEAAMKQRDETTLSSWVDLVRDVAEVNRLELESLNGEGERFRRLVELNVETQCQNLQKMKVVRESIRKNGTPTLHGWVFDIHTGHLTDLDFQY